VQLADRNAFQVLAAIDVSAKIEKKNGLSYLSWAWAVDQLMRVDPGATWEYRDPVKWGDTVMVFCTVTAFGKAMTAQLPVMDYRNKAIANPDSFAVNTAMQRCLVKAIALHGLGLYIYAGEDLPEGDHESVKHVPESAKSVGKSDFDKLPQDRQSALTDLSIEIADEFKASGEEKAYDMYAQARDGLPLIEEQAALRSLIPSQMKTAFTKIYNARNAK
jgi:hypothetical protein